MFYIDIVDSDKSFKRYRSSEKSDILKLCKKALDDLDDNLNVGFRIGWED